MPADQPAQFLSSTSKLQACAACPNTKIKPTWKDPSDQQWYCRPCWESYTTKKNEEEEARAGGDVNVAGIDDPGSRKRRLLNGTARIVGPSGAGKNYWSWAGAWFSIPGTNQFISASNNIRGATVNNRDAYLFAEILSHYSQPPVALGMNLIKCLIWVVYEPPNTFGEYYGGAEEERTEWLKECLPSNVYDRECFASSEHGTLSYAAFLGRVGYQFPRSVTDRYDVGLSFGLLDKLNKDFTPCSSIMQGDRLRTHIAAAIEAMQIDYAVLMLRHFGHSLWQNSTSRSDLLLTLYLLLRAAIKSCSITVLHHTLQALNTFIVEPEIHRGDGWYLQAVAAGALGGLGGSKTSSSFLGENHTGFQVILFSPVEFSDLDEEFLQDGILANAVTNALEQGYCCPPILKYLATNNYFPEHVQEKVKSMPTTPARKDWLSQYDEEKTSCSDCSDDKCTTPSNPTFTKQCGKWMTALGAHANRSAHVDEQRSPCFLETLQFVFLMGPANFGRDYIGQEVRGVLDVSVESLIRGFWFRPRTQLIPFLKLAIQRNIQPSITRSSEIFSMGEFCNRQQLEIISALSEYGDNLVGGKGKGGLRGIIQVPQTPPTSNFHQLHPARLILWLRYGLEVTPGTLHKFLDLWMHSLDDNVDKTNPGYWGGYADVVQPAARLDFNDSVEKHYFDIIRLLAGGILDLLRNPKEYIEKGHLSCLWGEGREKNCVGLIGASISEIDSALMKPISWEEFFGKIAPSSGPAETTPSPANELHAYANGMADLATIEHHLPDINQLNPNGKTHRFLKPVRPIRYLFSTRHKLYSLPLYILFLEAGADPTLPGGQDPSFDRNCDGCEAPAVPVTSWTQQDKEEREQTLSQMVKNGDDPLAILCHRDLDDGSLATWLDPRDGQWCCSVCWKKKMKEICPKKHG